MSLVCKQLLPHIKGKGNYWTLEQCHAKNLPSEGQPVGAGGEILGTVATVLQDASSRTNIPREVPCYVLDSNKLLWNGKVSDCDIVLGTNALSR